MPVILSFIEVNRAKGTDKQSLLLQMGKVGEEVDSALKKMRIIQVSKGRKGEGREGGLFAILLLRVKNEILLRACRYDL